MKNIKMALDRAPFLKDLGGLRTKEKHPTSTRKNSGSANSGNPWNLVVRKAQVQRSVHIQVNGTRIRLGTTRSRDETKLLH